MTEQSTPPSTDEAPAPAPEVHEEPAPQVLTEPVSDLVPEAAAELSADDGDTAPGPAPAPAAEATSEPATEATSEPAAEVTSEPAAEVTSEPAPAPTEDAAPADAGAEVAEQSARPTPSGPKGRGPRPVPHPGRRQGPRPTPLAARPALRPPSDPTPWGRMTEDGTVLVHTAAGERPVGTVVDATEEAALAHFGREFDALVAQVDVQEQRLMAGEVSPADVVGALRALRSSLAEASAVGDLDALAQRTRDLEAVAAERRAEADAARTAAREEALSTRSALVEEAERIAATDTARMQWRPSGERLRELLDAWKEAQRTSRLDKRTEDELWKRFSAARTSFDRARRAWFSQLESTNAEAKATKEALVTEAEALSTSTDWGPTSTAYRRLMDRWKAAGRASRKDDDALWARFRAAQDAFFSARGAANAEEDTEQRANLVVKEGLLTEAERLVPVKDFRAARAALRDLQERWEAAGRVPRDDLGRIERRLRAVEQAVTDAEKDRWRRSNPETRARAEGAVEQLERAVAGLERDLERARERGDARAEAEARASLEARRQWLATAQRTAQEFSG